MRTGVLNASSLHIVVTNPDLVEGVLEFFASLRIESSSISEQVENRFEYPALKMVWDLSMDGDSSLVIAYLHTKGMSYAGKWWRNLAERALTNFTFWHWRDVVRMFEDDEGLCQAGLMPCAANNFIWFNFWWARAKYIRDLEEPIITVDRWYYETWLAKSRKAQENPEAKRISLIDSSDRTFTQQEAIKAIRILKASYFLKFQPYMIFKKIIERMRVIIKWGT